MSWSVVTKAQAEILARARRNAAIILLFGDGRSINHQGWSRLRKLGWVEIRGKGWDFTPTGLHEASTELAERVRRVADEIDVRKRK